MRRGRTVYHCHGRKKGRKIRTYKTVAKAKRAHRAMSRRGKK